MYNDVMEACGYKDYYDAIEDADRESHARNTMMRDAAQILMEFPLIDGYVFDRFNMDNLPYNSDRYEDCVYGWNTNDFYFMPENRYHFEPQFNTCKLLGYNKETKKFKTKSLYDGREVEYRYISFIPEDAINKLNKKDNLNDTFRGRLRVGDRVTLKNECFRGDLLPNIWYTISEISEKDYSSISVRDNNPDHSNISYSIDADNIDKIESEVIKEMKRA